VAVKSKAISGAVRILEQDGVVTCPDCSTSLRRSQLDDHLRRQHGYVDIIGRKGKSAAPLPLGEALRELWRRMLTEQDEAAAVQWAGLFVERQGDRAVAAYTAALEQQLRPAFESLGPLASEEQPGEAWVRLGRCLAAHELTQRVSRALLTHPEAPIR